MAEVLRDLWQVEVSSQTHSLLCALMDYVASCIIYWALLILRHFEKLFRGKLSHEITRRHGSEQPNRRMHFFVTHCHLLHTVMSIGKISNYILHS